ncbi:3-hydroxyacyl-CoA dehydrogenase NAD-binding domain-containing protein [Subtercola endophyticus]|uniref:3-hydroxyacyl-CoA dehydrogenase NAD-binding domain-containing protein n=1 Tax=Subtercola endophyticus TaxID=2895559 RepID=UPI001E619B2F|nr:3-hydroxyacyl-CoA dehydrogenase NAD-binding domain-containing protein [Subtercola endophyticus]UFS57522.1 3-hydroxyacyl-CoA dehydrogenase NAD-binding domain-containing protein [Subtercola endophyticus]
MTTESEVHVEYAVLPGRARESALVHVGDPASRKPVIWGSERLASLTAAFDDIEAHEVEAVVLLGSAHSFGAGADLTALAAARTADDAAELGAEGWSTFRRLTEWDAPSFALITGFALGGALELALFADYRLARSDTRAIGLPEVRLGLVPGWGGIHRLARLAGPRVAYDVAVRDSRRGTSLSADDAARLGIIDQVVPAADWNEQWPAAVAALLPSFTPQRRQRRPSDEEYAAQLETVHSDFARSRPTVSAAPACAVELLDAAQTETLDEAQAATTAVFAELLLSDAGAASLYAYQLSRSPGRLPADLAVGSAQPVERAAVIGAGLMASQLATLLVRFGGLPVVLTDLDQARADRGAELVRSQLATAAEKGQLSETEAARLSALVSASAEPGAIAGADFVIEAIFENMAAKKQALAEAEKHLAPHALLATNTSSLSISEMADDLQHPERVIGFHIFNPVESVPLVEIIHGRQTDEATVATALELAAKLKRQAIVAADSPGFVVNRLLTRLYDVVMTTIDAGGDPLVVDHSIDDLGLPMSPLRLLDFVGPAIQLHVSETMHDAFPDRFSRLEWLTRVVDGGLRTVLQRDQTLTAEAAALLPAPDESTTGAELAASVRTGILDALTDEVDRMLAEGVVERAEDIDKAMILGANFPWALGGLTPYLRSRTENTRKNSEGETR